MKLSLISASTVWSAALLSGAQAAGCTSDLVVDNYSKYSSNTNSLGSWTSDDGTCTSLKADTANKKITFTASSSCYFYSTFPAPCEKATSGGYGALQFPVKGSGSGSLIVELQTSQSCSAAAKVTSYYVNVPVTTTSKVVTLPFSMFTGANPDAIQAVVFESFAPASGTWEVGQLSLVCANPGASIALSSSASSTVKSSATSSALVSSTIAQSSSVSTGVKAVSTSTASSAALTATTSTAVSISKVTTLSSTTVVLTSSLKPTATAGACADLLIDDFESQSRLTFLYYNAMMQPSSDDLSMTSVVVSKNHVTLTKKDASSYFYTNFGCLAANKYAGIGLTIKAAAGTTLTLELQSSKSCNVSNPDVFDVTSKQLGWTFDGTEKYYMIPFSKFAGLDSSHLTSLLFGQLSKAVTLGPMAFYCGSTGSAFPISTNAAVIEPSSTVPATTGPSSYVVDAFKSADTNALGFYHGGDDATTYKIASGKITFNTKGNSDLSWYSQLSNTCTDVSKLDGGYVHIAYTGSNAFTITLQQHNAQCDSNKSPFPFTWDDVEASRYTNAAKTDIYVPLTHFKIDRTKAVGLALKGFYTSDTTVVSKIEIVTSVPSGFLVPSKLDTAPLLFACKRPNSFAFAIDDGSPELAQTVIKHIADAGIDVTFFTVGLPLLDTSTNLSAVYNEMKGLGHQVAYHSFTHPPMEGLPALSDIDWELNQDIAAVKKTLNGHTSKYFRPPFGTTGARLRQRLASLIPDAQVINWSVDVQDYLWALSDTPEKQLDAFKSDVAKGGDLVVLHYLYQSTVDLLPEFIKVAKATGKQLMRVDQCMMDPNAPPLTK